MFWLIAAASAQDDAFGGLGLGFDDLGGIEHTIDCTGIRNLLEMGSPPSMVVSLINATDGVDPGTVECLEATNTPSKVVKAAKNKGVLLKQTSQKTARSPMRADDLSDVSFHVCHDILDAIAFSEPSAHRFIAQSVTAMSMITKDTVTCLVDAGAPAVVIDAARRRSEQQIPGTTPRIDAARAQIEAARAEFDRAVNTTPTLDTTPTVTTTPTIAPKPKPAPSRGLPPVDQRLVGTERFRGDAAVVVGLENYAFIPDVPHAKHDADAFYTFLLYTRGIPADRITQLTSGSNEHIRTAVRDAGRDVGPGGTVWVYYAGHGAASPTTGERILLGDDVRADKTGFESRGIAVAELETLATSNGAEAMLVLDTCYAGVGRGGDDILGGSRFAVPTYAVKPKTDSKAVQWNAAGPNELSNPLDSVGHGAFTYFVIGALRGWADGELTDERDGIVTGEEAQAYVTRALKSVQQRDQKPVMVGGSAKVLSKGVNEKGPSFR